MKTKDKKELHKKTILELKNLLFLTRQALYLLKLDKVRTKLKDTRSIFWKRKEIAQILTILKEKEEVLK